MSTHLATSRKICADADTSTPEDVSSKIGYVVKAETTVFGSLCTSAITFADRPLGVIEYSPETTAADIAAGNFKRATLINSGYAVCVAGVEITPGTHDEVKVHSDGTVAPVTGSEGVSYWTVGAIYDNPRGGAVVAIGDPVRILFDPHFRYVPQV